MRRIAQIQIILVAFLCLLAGGANAKVKITSSDPVTGTTNLVAGKKFYAAFDLVPANPSTNFDGSGNWIAPSSLPTAFNDYYFVNTGARIKLKVNESTGICLPNNFTFSVNIEYRKYNTSGVYEGAVTKTLIVNYDKNVGVKYKAMDFVQVNDVFLIGCKVVSVSNASLTPYVILDSELEVESIRKLSFINSSNETAMKALVSGITKANTTGGAAGISFNYSIANTDFANWADSVEIQWVYVDDEQAEITPPSTTATAGVFNFNNGVSVVLPYYSTSAYNTYQISNIYDKGYIFFRARAIGKAVTTSGSTITGISRTEGMWSIPDDENSVTNAIANFPGVVTDRFLPYQNWQYNCVFAEDGKKKEVIAYFDGAYRNRQTITESNTNDVKYSIAKETIYDFQGRPAIEVLPVPIQTCSLIYVSNLNRNQSNLPYSAADFDYNPGLTACEVPSAKMLASSNNGAANYYSPNNNWMAAATNVASMHQYIPSAAVTGEYYPFTQTEYTPDNTGRVSRTTQPGEFFKLGSGRETKYFYARPAQAEIDRLFGEEIGYGSHYTKEMVKDANGQLSISFKNASGQVIATALAGDGTSNLNVLNTAAGASQAITENLLNNNQVAIDKGFKLSGQIAVEKTATYKFKYSLNPQTYLANCSTAVYCLDCAYDLAISITDDCGNEKMPENKAFVKTIGPKVLADYNATCSPVNYSSSSESISGSDGFIDVVLSPGVYNISRTITVNKAALDFYKENYFESAACKTLTSFETEELAKISNTGCDICSQYSTYKANKAASKAAYTSAKLANYSGLTTAETAAKTAAFDAGFEAMMDEAAKYCEGGNPCDAYKAILLADVTPGGLYGKTNTTDDYYNKSVFNTSTSSALGHSYKDLAFFINTQVTLPGNTYPTSLALLTPAQLVSVWKDEYATELLVLHPEYYQYYNCLNFQASKQTDQLMANTVTYDDAVSVSKGYLNPVGTASGNFHDAFLDLSIDAATKTNFTNAINQAAIAAISGGALTPSAIGVSGELSLKELTAYLILCKDATSANRTTCISQALSGIATCDPTIKDLFWNTYKGLYQAIKTRFYTSLNDATKALNSPDYYSIGSTHLNFSSQYGKLIAGKERFAIGTNNVTSGANVDPDFAKQNCDKSCESYASVWIAKLGGCQFSENATTRAQQIADLKTALINVCKAGCDQKNPLGASTVRPGSGNIDKSFGDVLLRLGYYEGGKCDASSLDFPPAYGMPYASGTETGNNCGTKVSPYLVYGGCPKTTGTCEVANDNMATILNTIKKYSNDCPSNQICRSCQDVKDKYASFYATTALSETDAGFQSAFVLYMNERLGLNNNFTDYITFMNNCLGYLTTTSFSTAQVLEEFRHAFLIYKFDNNNLVVARLNIPHQETHFSNSSYNQPLYAGALNYYTSSPAYSSTIVAYNGTALPTAAAKNISAMMFAPPAAPSDAAVTPCACRKIQELKDQYDNLSSPSGFASYEAYLLSLGFDVPDASSILEACKQAFNQQIDNQSQQPFDKTSQFGEEQSYLLSSLAKDFAVPCEWCNTCNPGGGNGGSTNPTNPIYPPYNPGHDPEEDPHPNTTAQISACDLLRTALATSYPTIKPLDFLNEDAPGNSGYANLIDLYSTLITTYNTTNKFLSFDPQNITYIIEWYKRQLCNCGMAPELCATGNYFTAETTCPPVGTTPSTSKCTNCYTPDKKLLYIQKILNKLAVNKVSPYMYNSRCGGMVVKQNIMTDRNLNMYTGGLLSVEYGNNPLFYNSASSTLNWKAKINGRAGQESLNIEIADANTYKDYISLSLANSGDLGIGFAYLNKIVSIKPYYIPGVCGATKHFVVQALLTYTNAKKCIVKDSLITFTGTYKREITRETNCAVKDLRMCRTLPDPCEQMQQAAAKYNAQIAYDNYITAVFEQEEKKYINKCLSFVNDNSENFIVKFSANQYHYTLYYYDMAGNLVKTVPPAGVRVLTDTETNGVDTKRKGTTVSTNTLPTHKLPTTYSYNTLNQLIQQQTPDAGESRFWYDRVGRLVLSQNAKQNLNVSGGNNKFSYTIFDNLSRINEVGQLYLSNTIKSDIIADVFKVENETFIQTNIVSNTQKFELTRTYYDNNPDPAETNYTLNNLRSRVAKVAYFANRPATETTKPDHAVMYNYDATGNVTQVIRYVKSLEILNQHFKKVDYRFDVISGKVESVTFQGGKVDQYIHHYKYDAENRLVKTLSAPRKELIDFSANSAYGLRGMDAAYTYYLHGPLARTELGDLQVQGLDYAYTLQGWLKGVNSSSTKAIDDMGKDAYIAESTNPNKWVAKDEMGFILNYHDNDYSQVQQSTSALAYTNKFSGDIVSTNTGFAGYAKQLYNGNISSMVIAITCLLANTDGNPLISAYQYDQLNRLAEAKYFYKNTSNALTAASGWNNRFTYDANGNILTQKRDGAGANIAMDDLKYYYKGFTSTGTVVPYTYSSTGAILDVAGATLTTIDKFTNQLVSVKDAVTASGNYADDLENQADNDNYQYDDIGNLIKDKAEQIQEIEWTLYGKIKKITRTSGSTKPNIEFEYTPDGHRAVKIIIPANTSQPRIYTYYMRDAQGNILATYQREFNKTVDYEAITYTDLNSRLDGFASFIATTHTSTAYSGLHTALYNNITGDVTNTRQSQFLGYTIYDATTYLVSEEDPAAVNSLIASYTNADFIAAFDFWFGFSMPDLCGRMAARNAVNSSFENLASFVLSRTNTRNEFFTRLNTMNHSIFEDILSALPGVSTAATIGENLENIETFLNADPGNLAVLISACDTYTDILDCNNSGSVAMQIFSYLYNNDTDFKNTLMAIPEFKELYYISGNGSVSFSAYQFDMSDIIDALLYYDENAFKTSMLAYADVNNYITWFKNTKLATFVSYAVSIAGSSVIIGYQSTHNMYNTITGSNGVESYFTLIKNYYGQSYTDQLLNHYMAISELYVDKVQVSEWHTYGSSRLGVYKAAVTVVSKAVHITGTVNEGNINATEYSTLDEEPVLSNSSFELIRGAKNYELSNHLGNVLAVVTDKKIPVCSTTVFTGYKAEVLNANDYSPFGAPLAGRTFKAEEAQYQLVNDNFTDAITGWVANISSGYTMVIDDGRLKFDAGIPWAGIIKTFTTVPGKKYHISVKVNMGTTQALYLIVRNVGNVNNTVVVATTNGAYEIDFTAVDATTTFHLEGLNGSSTATRTFYIDDVLIQEATSKTYRFGFNGQEKDDEVSGVGNMYAFEYRIHDARLGKFLSIDPLTKDFPWNSPYNFAECSPIAHVDYLGLSKQTRYVGEDGVVLADTKDGNNSTITVKKDQRGAFDKWLSDSKSKGTLDNVDNNMNIIHQLTPNTQGVYFTSSSYGMKYMDKFSIQDKKEYSGYLLKDGFYVDATKGFARNLNKQYENEYGESGVYADIKKGKLTINGKVHSVSAFVHTHPYNNHWSGVTIWHKGPMAGKYVEDVYGDWQSFQSSFFKTTMGINKFILIGSTHIRVLTFGEGTYYDEILGDKKDYFNGKKKTK